jgi:hypothetical protein
MVLEGNAMSQSNVERVIGRLVTDEGFRRRFFEDPVSAIRQVVESGFELNACEAQALIAIDPHRVERFVEALHPCIQKVELQGGSK